MHVLVIQHLAHEHAGVLGEVMALAGVQTTTCRAWTGAAVPADPSAFDAVVVLGGDMNTDEDERWPHLQPVRDLLARSVEAAVPVLAICLGAQLLAEATGGRVTHGQPEIGYPAIHHTPSGALHPVIGALPDGTPMFNAHGDHVQAPPGSTLLAFSDAAAVHAFEVGSALGLQFHPEIDASFVATYVEADGVEGYLADNGWTGETLVMAARRHNEAHRAAGGRLFAAWLATIDS